MTDGTDARLLRLSREFAGELTNRVGAIIELPRPFSAATFSSGSTGRAAVGYGDEPLKFGEIPLAIGGRTLLRLAIKYDCCLDSSSNFLAVEKSWFTVRPGAKDRDNPLFRYEYLRETPSSVPSAHLQIHAHRDEMVHLLLAADHGRPREHARQDKGPHLSAFHFPLGGHRFRPCVEDVLEVLIREFAIDAKEQWQVAVREGREAWRRTQLRAAVRDAPGEAAETLQELGWTIEPPTDPPADNRRKLQAY